MSGKQLFVIIGLQGSEPPETTEPLSCSLTNFVTKRPLSK